MNEYPSLEDVENAARVQICAWYRQLRSPQTNDEIAVMNRLVERFKELGGFTPAISKEIGW